MSKRCNHIFAMTKEAEVVLKAKGCPVCLKRKKKK
jgi:hypothetical protein